MCLGAQKSMSFCENRNNPNIKILANMKGNCEAVVYIVNIKSIVSRYIEYLLLYPNKQ